jgi:diguanylate cyclase (GGDEF)-like protein
VTAERGVRFYAGHALADADGRKLGTLCIVDRRPREWSAADATALRDLAELAQVELRHSRVVGERDTYREKALVDSLTGLWNRAAILELLVRELARGDRDGADVAVVMGDLDHFKNVNDTYGHAAGDRVLAETAQRLRTVVRAYDAVGRYGGEEFLIVLPKCDLEAAARQAERLRTEVAAVPIEFEGQQIAVTISLGVAAGRCAVEELVRAADEALYAAKRAGRNRVEVATSVA